MYCDHSLDNTDNYFSYNDAGRSVIENTHFTKHPLPKPIPLSSTYSQRENFIFDDKLQRTIPIDSLGFIDQPIPLISPINTSTRLYPQSTRNHFNIDMTSEETESQTFNQNYLGKSKMKFNFNPPPKTEFQYAPYNKEITLHNKILINEASLESYSTPNFKDFKYNNPDKENEFTTNEEFSIKEKKKNSTIRPTLDLNLINDNEISNLFSESVVNSVKTLNNVNAQINLDDCVMNSKDVVKDITNENYQPMEKDNTLDEIIRNDTVMNLSSGFVNFTYSLNQKNGISPHNVKALFNISPKSAFMKIN